MMLLPGARACRFRPRSKRRPLGAATGPANAAVMAVVLRERRVQLFDRQVVNHDQTAAIIQSGDHLKEQIGLLPFVGR